MRSPGIQVGQALNRSHPLARGLVALYAGIPGRGNGGRLWDLSRTHHGTAIGAPAWKGFAPRSMTRAIEFENTTNAWSIPSTPALDSIKSILFWVYVRIYGVLVDGSIVSKFAGTAGTTDNRGIRIDGNNFYVTEENSNRMNLATWVTAGAWHHVAVTLSGTSAVGYVNATARATATFTGTWFNTGRELRIGAAESTFFDSGTASFSGSVALLEFYDRALSAAEVGERYRNPLAFFNRRSIYLGVPLYSQNLKLYNLLKSRIPSLANIFQPRR